MNEKNWAGNHTYEAAGVHVPGTVAEVQELVASLTRVKALGTRHCFNDIADFPAGELISLERLGGMELDRASNTVTIEGGVKYGDLAIYLDGEGFALPNLASLPHISVAGACATATHGSGVDNGNLATSVSSIEYVTANGELVSLSREGDGARFLGAVVGLGALGVVTRLTLDVEPAFEMRQIVYDDLPFAEVEAHFDEIMSSAYSVSLFTDWQGDKVGQVWRKGKLGTHPASFLGTPPETGGGGVSGIGEVGTHPASFLGTPSETGGGGVLGIDEVGTHPGSFLTTPPEAGGGGVSGIDEVGTHPASFLGTPPETGRGRVSGIADFFGAKAADGPRHPVPCSETANCTDQMGVPGPWHERLPHFKFGFRPSKGDELQAEYFVDREDSVGALRAVRRLSDRMGDLLWISEVRTVDADDLWMSPCYRRRSTAIHFTWKSNWPEVSRLLPIIEDALAPFDARPHWGKLFTMSPLRVRLMYARLGDFRALARDFDPDGKFVNPFLAKYMTG